ncbi:MAG: RNA recognition motif domain-containing protein [Flavobacteriales bacterium]
MEIYVGNLSFKVKEEELKQLFEQYGTVATCKIILDKLTRQSKGFGFVSMPDTAEAQKAIEELNSYELLGRNILVNESKIKEEEAENFKQKGGGFKGGFGNKGGFGGKSSGGFNKPGGHRRSSI